MVNDIQKDYLRYDERDGRIKPIANENGFLEYKFSINGKNYRTISSERTNSSFKLTVKDVMKHEKVFEVEILYGKIYNNDQHILFIQDFHRVSNEPEGVGKSMAMFIRNLAESRGFNQIWVHPVHSDEKDKEYMSEEDLKKFYKKYLNSDKVKLEFKENCDGIVWISWNEEILKNY